MTITERTVAEMWPEHAGHMVLYSEHGRTDYVLNSLELVDTYTEEGKTFNGWSANDYEVAPIYGDISETEVWCRDCGVHLSTETEENT